MLLIYAPPLAGVYELAPLGLWHWLLLATFGPLLLILEEARKGLRRSLLPDAQTRSEGNQLRSD